MPAKKLTIHSEIDLDDLVGEIVTLGDEQIFDLIKAIDWQVADYDFTKKLRDYLVKEMEKEDKAKEPIAPVIIAREY
jgi:hypothetical protein